MKHKTLKTFQMKDMSCLDLSCTKLYLSDALWFDVISTISNNSKVGWHRI